MSSQTRKPIRAGRAFLENIKNDPAAQAAWQRVRTGLRAVGEAMRSVLESTNAARAGAITDVSETLQRYRELGAALGTAVSGNFERLRAVVVAYPGLREVANDLERAVRELRQRDEQQQAAVAQRLHEALADLPDPLHMLSPPTFDDPAFWSSVTPVGEQIRDAFRGGMQEQAGRKRGKVSVADVVAQLERYRVAGGPYLDQRTFSRLCGCQPSTVNKAIQKNTALRAWKDAARRARKQGAAPRRDTGDFDIVLEQVAAKSEQPVMADEVDAIMEKLRRQAARNPEWVGALDEMSPDERAKTAQLYADGDYEPSFLEPDAPGERPRKVKRHGRV